MSGPATAARSGCLRGIPAEVADRASGAFGPARLADVAPMQDQPVMGIEPVGLGHDRLQPGLHLVGGPPR